MLTQRVNQKAEEVVAVEDGKTFSEMVKSAAVQGLVAEGLITGGLMSPALGAIGKGRNPGAPNSFASKLDQVKKEKQKVGQNYSAGSWE